MTILNDAYQSRIADGELQPDKAQLAMLALLQNLLNQLEQYQPRPASLFKKLFTIAPTAPRGIYIYGGVGRGKSMLMDLFYVSVPIEKKRRVHFHQFMLEIHDRLHRLQKDDAPNVLPNVAREIANETNLLCFDEFHVGNIADAMILGRLFEALFASGVVIVATSNWTPDDLYQNGLQRERFLPFIALIKQHLDIYFLDSATDYRFEQTRTLPCYFQPISEENTRKLQATFFQLTNNADPQLITLPVQGRQLQLTHTAQGVGFFNFEELCVIALGAADYLAIAQNLHTVLIDGVPRLNAEKSDQATRFINLIDALYEARVRLYMVAETTSDKLAPEGKLNFPFQRTLSRLMEMQGEVYRQKMHLGK